MEPAPKQLLQDYVMARITRRDDCWEWNLSCGSHGYPQGSVPAVTGRRVSLAHRLSYQAFIGEIGDGLQVDHLCRNRRCVNPQHLEAVPQALNVRRQFGGSEDLSVCRRGHAGAWFTNSKGYSECRECKRVRTSVESARRRARLAA